MKIRKEIETTLVTMGFVKVTTNQFSHEAMGYIHVYENWTMRDLGFAIFNLGQYKKCDEIKAVLMIKERE